MRASGEPRGRERRRLRVYGVVQGVGFRPFVYALATELRLGGFVGNDSRGVFIEVEGALAALDRFAERLTAGPPPLAVIDRVETETVSSLGEPGFTIVESVAESKRSTPVSPDISVCEDCLRELMDPGDRRYQYPFINCTNCGPRFTIIQNVPYDRSMTTMRRFTMCPDCDAEYHDPGNRRFHAQPNACAVCGPRVWFSERDVAAAESSSSADPLVSNAEAVARCRRALADGLIVAVKGIGGFHLACDARSDDACRRLRERKGRVDKPLALMARDLDAVGQYTVLTKNEAAILRSKERPIVLLPNRRGGDALSSLVAPGNRTLGMMLPYSPLHYLLLEDYPLVMTSGNRSEEPIVKDNDEAVERLGELADAFLFHDRDIEVVCDDSVIRVVDGRELPIRRSRGYAPFPLKSPMEGPSVLAVGGELKATFCLTKDGIAYLSQHMGDMENLETLHAFERGFEHMARLFVVEPEAVVCDRHPGYLSTGWAERHAEAHGLPLVRVQHHHAHIASVMAESGMEPGATVVGLACDGTGYGADGAVWGCEILHAGYGRYERLGHLRYVPLPGGDAAIRKPYRMALAYLQASGLDWDERLPPVRQASPEERRLLSRQIERGLNCPPTSSLGRLFDAVAALAGVRQTASYEAQAALELETIASLDDGLPPYRFHIDRSEPFLIDPEPVLAAVAQDVATGVAAAAISGRFHRGVAELIERAAALGCERAGVRTVALSGGVFQNVLLLSLAKRALGRRGFRVLTHHAVPPNDGGLALGQAAVATAALVSTPQAPS